MAWRRIDEVCETLLNRLNIDAEACVGAQAMADALKRTASITPAAECFAGGNHVKPGRVTAPSDTRGDIAARPSTMLRGKYTRTGVYLALVMSR